ncbi:unnamed protein product [Dovyalis caffra]|uniref:Uncharacterized protein n=1 Tax=Dovyalis caffra TaxID=77055 RepID=A0AAV1RXK2_9ROSI|nr:unnamed protein product [Dovyalis caffra]
MLHQNPVVSDLMAIGLSATIALSVLHFFEETAKQHVFDQMGFSCFSLVLNFRGKDSKAKDAGAKGKGKEKKAGGSDENGSKGKEKSGKASDGLGTCTYDPPAEFAKVNLHRVALAG